MRMRLSPEREQEILQFVKDHPTMRYEDVARRFGFAPSARGSSVAYLARKAGIVRGRGGDRGNKPVAVVW